MTQNPSHRHHSARTRPMAVDGYSFEAEGLATVTTKAKVQVVIVSLLGEFGPLTDDALVEQYDARRDQFGAVPSVTPQRIRTARADLARRGIVRSTPDAGLSKYGNKATKWKVA